MPIDCQAIFLSPHADTEDCRVTGSQLGVQAATAFDS